MAFFRTLFSTLLLLVSLSSSAQTISNGNFFWGILNWSCLPEIGVEATYGGVSMVNSVSEVDALAGLCQNITGLTPGSTYYVSMDATRRTGGCPSPLVTNISVAVGGTLAGIVTRTNTAFNWTNTGFVFTATNATHMLNISAGSGFGSSTCGMIIDNLVVSPISVLPIELIDFSGKMNDTHVELSWSTATEKNNDYFEVERSTDGVNFEKISVIPSKSKDGNSSLQLSYTSTDNSPLETVTYYRLKQTDKDKTFSMSKLIEVPGSKKNNFAVSLYPNPNKGSFFIDVTGSHYRNKMLDIMISDQLGHNVYSTSTMIDENGSPVNIAPETQLPTGYYFCHLTLGQSVHHQKLLVE